MAVRPVLTLAPVTAPSAPPDAPSPLPTERNTEARGEAAPRAPGSLARAAAQGDRGGSLLSHPTGQSSEAAWRCWGQFHHTVSFKWPPELVAELDNCRHDLREPVGLMVVAAVTHLLDHDDEAIRALIDRVEQAKPRSGRGRPRT